MRMDFELVSKFKPRGDQPEAITALLKSLKAGSRFQTLLGVTGSGKTFTIANVIEALQRPTLVISHNKTLAAQLYSEFKQFFPRNAVEYFVSYFDYYQPEAYIPQTDTYIEKDSSINEEIERLRLSATSALMSRRDVIVVASVSCIYGLGSPEDWLGMLVAIKVGETFPRDVFLRRLVDIQYDRNDLSLQRGNFRVRGDVIELCPSYMQDALRVEFFGDQIERITRFDPLTGRRLEDMPGVSIFPAKHWVTPPEKIEKAIETIKVELAERIEWFEQRGKLLEAQRLKMRTDYDMEMMQEMGFCSGIENYSRHLSGRAPGQRPFCLMDFFPKDFLLVIDESHATVPQLGGMYEGDRSRKLTLVEHGFRLPSALDNRPLNFAEFESMINQAIFVSATPAQFEIGKSAVVAEQIVRPTGLLDPKITVKPLTGMIDDVIELIRQRTERKERVLVTTLTKRTAEDLSDYLRDLGIKVTYLHADVDTIERVEILRGLRAGKFDVLVGINLLREGLDLPEVSLVCILDADKEGYLRSATALIQVSGRAARHINAEVVLYADVMTDSIKELIRVSDYRRKKQEDYNHVHKITPKSVVRGIQESLHTIVAGHEVEASVVKEAGADYDVMELIRELEAEMLAAAKELEFERAALLRDQIKELKTGLGEGEPPKLKKREVVYALPNSGKSARRKR
ncbi:MAG: excinuclease ABC subunit UvrB [Verrucomicrobia bacterium]|nr:excinuclease ABC subunit UvrB [Verrucomicrobiota bacterium]